MQPRLQEELKSRLLKRELSLSDELMRTVINHCLLGLKYLWLHQNTYLNLIYKLEANQYVHNLSVPSLKKMASHNVSSTLFYTVYIVTGIGCHRRKIPSISLLCFLIKRLGQFMLVFIPGSPKIPKIM